MKKGHCKGCTNMLPPMSLQDAQVAEPKLNKESKTWRLKALSEMNYNEGKISKICYT